MTTTDATVAPTEAPHTLDEHRARHVELVELITATELRVDRLERDTKRARIERAAGGPGAAGAAALIEELEAERSRLEGVLPELRADRDAEWQVFSRLEREENEAAQAALLERAVAARAAILARVTDAALSIVRAAREWPSLAEEVRAYEFLRREAESIARREGANISHPWEPLPHTFELFVEQVVLVASRDEGHPWQVVDHTHLLRELLAEEPELRRRVERLWVGGVEQFAGKR